MKVIITCKPNGAFGTEYIDDDGNVAKTLPAQRILGMLEMARLTTIQSMKSFPDPDLHVEEKPE